MAQRTIGPVDTIWLNMDRADNLMVIESLLLTDGPVDPARLREVLEERVLTRYPVFSQRPRRAALPWSLPRWEDDPDFDVERHLLSTRLPAPGDDAAVQEHVSAQLDLPLPRDRPLWQVHLLQGYAGTGTAVYSRIHHSLADGMALMEVLLSLTDATPDGGRAEPAQVTGADDGGASLLDTGLSLAGHVATPARLAATARSAVGLGARSTAVAWKLLAASTPATPVTGQPHARKRAVWSEPVPLSVVHDAAHRTGTTVNDVLVAALSGALHRYQDEHGAEPVDVATMVPVNLRPPDQPLPAELGNRFALVLLWLPSGSTTPFERLAETSRRMDAIKHSPEPWLTFTMISAIGRTGPRLERRLVDHFADKAIGVTTNVPGPPAACFLAGQRVTGMLGWAPESGRQTLGTCIVSHDGRLRIGFKVDLATIEEPHALVEAFDEELVELCRLAPAPLQEARG